MPFHVMVFQIWINLNKLQLAIALINFCASVKMNKQSRKKIQLVFGNHLKAGSF